MQWAVHTFLFKLDLNKKRLIQKQYIQLIQQSHLKQQKEDVIHENEQKQFIPCFGSNDTLQTKINMQDEKTIHKVNIPKSN